MSESKIIFFDIDGTVWDWQGVTPESAKETIIQLKKNGHIPIICSGRARGHIIDEELLSLGFRGIIAACGEYVEIDNDIIFEQTLDDELVRKIIRLSMDCNVPVVLEGSEYHCVSTHGFDKDDFVVRMQEAMGEKFTPLEGYRSDMKINKFSGDVINSSDYGTFKKNLEGDFTFIEHGLALNIDQNPGAEPDEIQCVFEVVTPGSSKANGIRIACEYLGVDIEDTFAVGDSNNDIEMLQYVKHGIAMGNSSEGLKEVADYVTTDIWEDGLKNAMIHYGLI